MNPRLPVSVSAALLAAASVLLGRGPAPRLPEAAACGTERLLFGADADRIAGSEPFRAALRLAGLRFGGEPRGVRGADRDAALRSLRCAGRLDAIVSARIAVLERALSSSPAPGATGPQSDGTRCGPR